MIEQSHEHRESYRGAATLDLNGTRIEVQVDLRGHVEPLDGRFHWYGRIAVCDALADQQSGSSLAIRTPHGSAEGRVADLDPWGRFRITGLGTPPF